MKRLAGGASYVEGLEAWPEGGAYGNDCVHFVMRDVRACIAGAVAQQADQGRLQAGVRDDKARLAEDTAWLAVQAMLVLLLLLCLTVLGLLVLLDGLTGLVREADWVVLGIEILQLVQRCAQLGRRDSVALACI